MVSPLRVGLVALALAACLTGTVFMAQGSGSVYRGDPQSFRLVAEAPFGKGTQIESDPDVATHGVAYRYGRILFPVLAWMLALGRSGLVPWSLPVVGALSFAACAAVAATLCRDVSQPCERGLVVAGVPTLLAATVLVYAEPLAMALMLGVFLTYLRERKGWSAVLAAGLVLSREVLVLALLPIAWSEWRSGHRSRLLLGAATALGPFAVWASWVRIRVGEWPFLDPSESRRAAVGLPPAALLQVIREANGEVSVVVGAVLLACVAGGTVVVGLVVYRRIREDRLLAASALLLSGSGMLLGAQPYRFPGDGLRVLLPAHVLLALLWARNHVARQPPGGASNPGARSRRHTRSPEALIGRR